MSKLQIFSNFGRIMALIDDIALTLLPKVGPKTAAELIERYGDARTAIDQSPFGASVDYDRAEYILQVATHKGIRILVRGTADYPELLGECPDAPHVLYVQGSLAVNRGRWVAVVGTRKATTSGTAITQRMVSDLATAFNDLVVVSGLAFGIDKAAHLAAMEVGRPTVAVMAGWVEEIVPPSHHYIARQILHAGGAIVSDMPPGTVIKAGNFLSRNRLIAGLSHATVVTESAAKGGSLVTADIAASYDRPVFAVPGRSDDPLSSGTNTLIKSSRAILYQSPSDLASELGWRCADAPTVEAIEQRLGGELLELYQKLPAGEPFTLEGVAHQMGWPIHETSSRVMALEVRGAVHSLPGRLFEKV